MMGAMQHSWLLLYTRLTFFTRTFSAEIREVSPGVTMTSGVGTCSCKDIRYRRSCVDHFSFVKSLTSVASCHLRDKCKYCLVGSLIRTDVPSRAYCCTAESAM